MVNWPTLFKLPSLEEQQNTLPRRQSRSMVVDGHREEKERWSWLCSDCLKKIGRALIGRTVQVWWHDDSQAYRGRVTEYDDSISCPCVSYEDDEWEFVNLAVEPFVLLEKENSDEARV